MLELIKKIMQTEGEEKNHFIIEGLHNGFEFFHILNREILKEITIAEPLEFQQEVTSYLKGILCQ